MNSPNFWHVTVDHVPSWAWLTVACVGLGTGILLLILGLFQGFEFLNQAGL